MRSLKRLVIAVLILALGGGITILLSELNARTYSVQVVDGNLVVMKGKLFPIGADPYRPGDPALRDVYAPIPLDGTSPGSLPEQRFTEREELDRALFDVVGRLAKARVASEDPRVLEQGLYYLRRAERLSGLTEEQKRSLKDMHSEVAYYLARTKLDDARSQVAEAIVQLKLAATTQNRHAHSANQMILELEPAAKAFEEALRMAAHGLSEPPGFLPVRSSSPAPSASPEKGAPAGAPGRDGQKDNPAPTERK
jgi:hypothetical protein